jgi:hypothetical protein
MMLTYIAKLFGSGLGSFPISYVLGSGKYCCGQSMLDQKRFLILDENLAILIFGLALATKTTIR